MKNLSLCLTFLSALLLTMCACSHESAIPEMETEAPDNPDGEGQTDEDGGESASRTLVAYFSCTGTTQGVAAQLAEITGADLIRIEPAEPYTEADLNYGNPSSRATQEQNDPTARPAISNEPMNLNDYNCIILGYPIWWGKAPRIISTFLESHDFTGKTIIPFCTSHSSGIGSSATDLHALAPGAQWEDGRRFSGSESRETIAGWIERTRTLWDTGNPDVSAFNLKAGVNGKAPTLRLNSGYDMPIVGLGTGTATAARLSAKLPSPAPFPDPHPLLPAPASVPTERPSPGLDRIKSGTFS